MTNTNHAGAPADSASDVTIQEPPSLRKSLKNRHIQLIALGGAIGTGLFYGSSESISLAGPAILLAYLIGGKEPNQKYAHIDIGLSVSQLCYAATQQGLSTCIMGSFDQKMLLDSLGITEPKRVLLVVAVGYAATDALRPKKRKPLDEVMTYIG